MHPMEYELEKAAREIANEVIYSKRVKDNVTVILVGLNRGHNSINNL